MSDTCVRPSCPRPAAKNTILCKPHFLAARRAGLVGKLDAKPVQSHLEELLERGWRYSDIARVTRLSPACVRAQAIGARTHVHASVARKILAVPLTAPLPLTPFAVVDAQGFNRRVQALARIGWLYKDLANRLECHYRDVYTSVERGVVSRALHARMVEVYEELQHVPGGSQHAVTKATNKGWHPPAAWDDIDNDPEPAAVTPAADLIDEVAVQRAIHTGDGSRLTDAEKEEVVRLLLAKGATRTEAARVVHWSFYRTHKVAA